MDPMDQIKTATHRTNRNQIILELVFDGGKWQVDSEIREGIAEAMKASPPAAILLDLSSFRYRGGDYISGFVEAFLDKGHGRARPACFVRPPRGVKSLFDAIDPSGTLGVRYFRDRAEALEYLRTCLETPG
jgi:hypothetical protein